MINIKENEELSVLNHSCAHLMAQAVKHLFPHAKFWVGPVIEEGFYYDIDLGEDVIKDEDIEKIEKEMKKIVKDGKRIVRHELSREEALEMFKDDEYKIDLINNMDDSTNILMNWDSKQYLLCHFIYIKFTKRAGIEEKDNLVNGYLER